VIFPGGSRKVFDSLECAIHVLAPTCKHCGCKIIGHGLEVRGASFCCEHCAHSATNDSIDEASEESFPASDPPALPASAMRTAGQSGDRSQRLREGRIGWILLWLLGIPLPLLLVLYALRGCT
jgi:hypothetical protein